MPCASSTVMRSLEWATSERKRASLWRRWRSSASDAPSTASETCEASASSESTSSRGTTTGEQSDEQAAHRVADRERQEEHGVPAVEAKLAANVARAASRGRDPLRSAFPTCSQEPVGRLRERPFAVLAGRGGDGRAVGVQRDEADVRAAVSTRRLDGRDRGLVDLLAPGRADELDTRARAAPARASAARSSWRTRPAMRATTRRKRTAEATIRTRTSGLPIAWKKRIARRDQARGGEQGEAERGQARARLERRLLERPHRRVQRRGAPEEVEGDPADVVDQLVVVRALEQRVVVRRVDREEADDAADEEVEGGRALAGVDREADRGGEQQDVAERVRDRDGLLEQASGPRGGCSARSRNTHESRAMPTVRISESITPARSPCGFRRRTSTSSPAIERRVDGQVDGVADRRELDLDAHQLRVAVRVEVAGEEEELPDDEQPPGDRAPSGRWM